MTDDSTPAVAIGQSGGDASCGEMLGEGPAWGQCTREAGHIGSHSRRTVRFAPAVALGAETEKLVHAAEWLNHLRSDEPLMSHTAADNLERVIHGLVAAQEQSGTALVNLNDYIIDLQTAVKDLMTALGNAYHPAYEQGRKVLAKGSK